MPITPDTRSPSMVRGISLTEETNTMVEELAEHYAMNVSAVVRALIRQEHELLFVAPEETQH